MLRNADWKLFNDVGGGDTIGPIFKGLAGLFLGLMDS